METHPEDNSSLTTEERDESSSESSITTENSFEEEIDPWINDAASKVRAKHYDVLQVLLMKDYDKSEAKQEAFEKILPPLKRN